MAPDEPPEAPWSLDGLARFADGTSAGVSCEASEAAEGEGGGTSADTVEDPGIVLEAPEGAYDTDLERLLRGVLPPDSRVLRGTVRGSSGGCEFDTSWTTECEATGGADCDGIRTLVLPRAFSYRIRNQSMSSGRGVGRWVGENVGSTYVDGSDTMRKMA